MSNEVDYSHLWMPFTTNRLFKRDPKIFVRAKGMYYWTQGAIAQAKQVFQACYDNGVLVRAAGDNLVLSPHLIIEKE